MTPEQYRKLKEKEQIEAKNKKYAAYGPQSFKSRSLKAFQTDLEAGKTGHLLPVFNAKDRLKKGEISAKDIPYMQRLGAWDDSDIGGKRQWTTDDKGYNPNSAPAKLNWSEGSPVPRRAQVPPPKGKTQQQPQQSAPKKGLFGLW